MNFFERQATARRASLRLLLLFALAVAGIMAAADLLAALAFGASAGVLAFTTLATLAIIGLGSLYRIASLRGGGEAVALQLGGVPVAEDTGDFNLRRLRNVVEEVAIASGVPVPKVYVLEHEASINAFAAGYSPSDAVVAVTRGALDRLNRDELQGVIAHEFSHILNGDMRLNVRLIGLLFGILMLAVIGRRILQHGGRVRGRGAAGILIAAVAAMVVGYVGLFFARLIKAGVSRQRERLADASAVQFTRQTTGLAGALKKIGGLQSGSRLEKPGDAEEVSHMLFGDGIGLSGQLFGKFFATHPPLIERIQALEPGFRGEQLKRLQLQWLTAPPNGLEEDLRLGLAASGRGALPDASAQLDLTPPMVAAQVAQPGYDDYRRADAIAANLPDPLRTLAARHDAVMPMLLGLLLSEDADVQRKQLAEIRARLGASLAQYALEIRQQWIAALHPALRLPLAAIAFPVLRLRPRPELDVFMDTVFAVANADGRVSLFEYCLGTLLQVQVREALDPARYARFGRRRLSDAHRELAALLAIVAQTGHADEGAARRAYLAGMQRVLPREHLPYQSRSDVVQALDAVWEPLDALDPLAKQALVEGLTAAIGHDGRVAVPEAELLRTVCAVLHCPLPVVLGRD
jgi:Zn-dependent protease with chaperone function